MKQGVIHYKRINGAVKQQLPTLTPEILLSKIR